MGVGCIALMVNTIRRPELDPDATEDIIQCGLLAVLALALAGLTAWKMRRPDPAASTATTTVRNLGWRSLRQLGPPLCVDLGGPLMTALDDPTFTVNDFWINITLVDPDRYVLDADGTVIGIHPVLDGEGRLIAGIVGPDDESLTRSKPTVLAERLDPQRQPSC